MKCFDCPKRTGESCLAHAEAVTTFGRDFPAHPFGGCVVPIVESYCALINSRHRILEIGCGTWSPIKDYCERVGARYEGIDVAAEYYGKPTVATRLENIADLSFEDGAFDFVIGNQTLEHWGEYGCRTQWGLQQCFRVTKDGGNIFMNVPIHFHGVTPFLMGRLDQIREMLQPYSNTIEFVPWGQETAPMTPLFAHPRFSALKSKPAYILDIRATKDKKFHLSARRGYAPTGLLARLINNPSSYVMHQALVRSRLKSRA